MTKSRDDRSAREKREALIEQIQSGALTIGEAVRAMRKTTGLNQRDYAQKILAIPVRTLSEIERDLANPTVETLNRVGRPFGLQAGFIPKRATASQQAKTAQPAPPIRAEIPESSVSNDDAVSSIETASGSTSEPEPDWITSFKQSLTVPRSPEELDQFIKDSVQTLKEEQSDEASDFLKRKRPYKDFRDEVVLLSHYAQTQSFDSEVSVQWLAGDGVYDGQIVERANNDAVLEDVQLTVTEDQAFWSLLDRTTAEVYDEPYDKQTHLENFQRRIQMQAQHAGVMSGNEAALTAAPLLVCAATRKFLADYSSTDATAVLAVGFESLPPPGQARTEFIESIEAVAWSISFMEHRFDKIALVFSFGDVASVMVPMQSDPLSAIQDRLQRKLTKLQPGLQKDDESLDWGSNPSGARQSGSNRWTFTLRTLGEHLFNTGGNEYATRDDGLSYPEFHWQVPSFDSRTKKTDGLRPGFVIRPTARLLHRLAFSEDWKDDTRELAIAVEALVFRYYGQLVKDSAMDAVDVSLDADVLDH